MFLVKDLIPALQVTDRITGKQFVWSATDPKRIAVWPRTEPDTFRRPEAFIEFTEMNPITGMPTLPVFESEIRAYLMNAVQRVR